LKIFAITEKFFIHSVEATLEVYERASEIVVIITAKCAAAGCNKSTTAVAEIPRSQSVILNRQELGMPKQKHGVAAVALRIS
jgi:hypothetical protein